MHRQDSITNTQEADIHTSRSRGIKDGGTQNGCFAQIKKVGAERDRNLWSLFVEGRYRHEKIRVPKELTADLEKVYITKEGLAKESL